jgi:electron transfer flavoprotein alpha subunit
MQIGDYKGVWVYTEQRNGKLLDVGLELLGAGRQLADSLGEELCAVLLGDNVESLAAELAAYGAEKVYLASAPILKQYTNDAYSLVLEDMINKYKPSIFLLGGTAIGMDLAPRVAAKVGTGLSAHSVSLNIDSERCLRAGVPAFGGSWVASIACPNHRPQMATIPAGFTKKIEKKGVHKANIEKVEVKVKEAQVRTKVLGVYTDEPKSKPISQAETVICGGYGIGSKENWKMIDKLASVLRASVGATRPACDEGWAVLEEQMVGQSGKTVRPNLYIGAGISGAIHHLVGIKDSKKIVAINTDPNAPILKSADYAIVGDFREIIPALIEELKKPAK